MMRRQELSGKERILAARLRQRSQHARLICYDASSQPASGCRARRQVRDANRGGVPQAQAIETCAVHACGDTAGISRFPVQRVSRRWDMGRQAKPSPPDNAGAPVCRVHRSLRVKVV
ncbi:hypothetical protein MRX96_059044 [Rhipicephalus microplus]